MKKKVLLILMNIWCFGNDLALNDFSQLKCDKIRNNEFFEICYSYEHKAAISSYTKLLGPNMDAGNIKERDDFYDDQEIPKEFRTKDSDYIKKKLDRGHINGDASFDWSEDSLHATYALSNIVPQYPNTNRHSYLNVEKEERAKAKELGYVEVRVDIEYNSGKKNGKYRYSFFI